MSCADRLLSFPDMTEFADSSAQVSWDHPRSAGAARLLVEVGREHGLRPDQCLFRSGLAEAELADPATVVEATQELAIARNLIRQLGNRPGLGLEVGLRYRFSTFGVWGFAILSSTTAREVVRLGVRYAPLSFAFIEPFIEQDDHELRVVLDEHDIPADVRDFFVEREIAKLAQLLPAGLGSATGIRFETAFTGERAAMLAASFPDVPISRGDRHLLALDPAILDLPLPQADPVTARELEDQCAALLQSRRSRRGVAAAVRDRILVRLADPPSMEATAAVLHIDPRTLRRQLATEGTSYRELTDEVRTLMADELLHRAHLTVAEVARRLGYHDAAGFTRAYKRWTGTTPKQRQRPHGHEVRATRI